MARRREAEAWAVLMSNDQCLCLSIWPLRTFCCSILKLGPAYLLTKYIRSRIPKPKPTSPSILSIARFALVSRCVRVPGCVQCPAKIICSYPRHIQGTAIQNNYTDLWAILDWSNPGRLGTAAQWNEWVSTPLARGQDSNASGGEIATGRVCPDLYVVVAP